VPAVAGRVDQLGIETVVAEGAALDGGEDGRGARPAVRAGDADSVHGPLGDDGHGELSIAIDPASRR
jgi:hypothetical protein